MNSPAAAHADTAAEAIRSLNHATLPGAGGLREPADAHDVLAYLATMTDRLRQAITQVQYFLDQQHAAGAIRIVDGDHRGNPRAAISECRELTYAAASQAGALGHTLHASQQTLTWAAVTGSRRRDSGTAVPTKPGGPAPTRFGRRVSE